MTLREAMHSREGTLEAERQIAMGRRAYAIERRDAWGAPRTTIVFGTCTSDALRRASAPMRLGEEFADTQTHAMEITSGWDEPVLWPFERAVAR